MPFCLSKNGGLLIREKSDLGRVSVVKINNEGCEGQQDNVKKQKHKLDGNDQHGSGEGDTRARHKRRLDERSSEDERSDLPPRHRYKSNSASVVKETNATTRASAVQDKVKWQKRKREGDDELDSGGSDQDKMVRHKRSREDDHRHNDHRSDPHPQHRYHDHRTLDDDSKHSDNNISYRDKETGRSIPRAQGTRHRDDSDLEVRDNSEKDWKEGGLKPDKKRRLNDTNKDGEQRKKEKGKVETAKMKAKSNDPDDDEITISDVERSFEFEGRIVGKTLKEADYSSDEKKPPHKKRHKKRQRHQSRRKRRNYSSSD